MIELDDIIKAVKLLWPIAAWVALVNQRLKHLEHDVDTLYYLLRGKKGMRVRSLSGRIRRLKFQIRKRINGSSVRKHSN